MIDDVKKQVSEKVLGRSTLQQRTETFCSMVEELEKIETSHCNNSEIMLDKVTDLLFAMKHLPGTVKFRAAQVGAVAMQILINLEKGK